jgi:hypothetical protein
MTFRLRRRLLLGLLALPILLLLADYLVWRSGELLLDTRVAEWMAARRADGWTVASGPTQAGGWPLAVAVTLSDLTLAGDPSRFPGGAGWHADRLTLRVALLHPRDLVLAVEGRQRLRIGDPPDVTFAAGRMVASIPLDAGTPPGSVHILANDLRIDLPPPAGGGQVTVGAIDLQLSQAAAAPPSMALQADDIGLPAGSPARWPLGPRVAEVALDATLAGPTADFVPVANRLTVWRDAGGSVRVQRCALRWGPLDLTATGVLSLDAALQPSGTVTTQIVGQAAALDAMAASGAIKPQAAFAAKAVLALMGTPASADAPASLSVPLTLQDRTLAMGRIPLIRVPQIAWPVARVSAISAP